MMSWTSSDGLRVAQFPEFRSVLGVSQDLVPVYSNPFCDTLPRITVTESLWISKHHLLGERGVPHSRNMSEVPHVMGYRDISYGLLTFKDPLYALVGEYVAEVGVFRIVWYRFQPLRTIDRRSWCQQASIFFICCSDGKQACSPYSNRGATQDSMSFHLVFLFTFWWVPPSVAETLRLLLRCGN